MTITKQMLNRTAGPAAYAVTLVEAKKQLELLASDTFHDDQLTQLIQAATEQVEDDTEHICISQTYELLRDAFPSESYISIPLRPIQSIASITYYDTTNTQQTLATSVYGLDKPRRQVYLKHDQGWPDITEQRNGIVITLDAGYGDTDASVPRIIKEAILLQIAKWFIHRGDESEMPAHDTAYERIIARIKRSSYP